MKQYKYIYINFRVKFHLNEIVLIIHSFSLHSHSTLYSLRWLFMSSIKKTLSKLTGFFSRLNLKHSKMCQPTAIYRWEPVHSFKRSNSLIKRQWCKLQLRHCAVAHLFDETAAYYIISARRLLMFKQHGNNSVVFFFSLISIHFGGRCPHVSLFCDRAFESFNILFLLFLWIEQFLCAIW